MGHEDPIAVVVRALRDEAASGRRVPELQELLTSIADRLTSAGESPPLSRGLRPALVGLGSAIGVERYVGQHPTDAAHDFADAALAVIKELRGG